MGGTATKADLAACWLVAVGEHKFDARQDVVEVLQRGLRIKLLRHVSASGLSRGSGGDRRRSSAASTVGRFVFWHLRIADCIHELMLSDEKTALHALCASAREDKAETDVLAYHHEQSGARRKAAALYFKASQQAANLTGKVACALAVKAHECLEQHTKTEGADTSDDELEVQIVFGILGTYPDAELCLRFSDRLTELVKGSAGSIVKPGQVVFLRCLKHFGFIMGDVDWDNPSASNFVLNCVDKLREIGTDVLTCFKEVYVEADGCDYHFFTGVGFGFMFGSCLSGDLKDTFGEGCNLCTLAVENYKSEWHDDVVSNYSVNMIICCPVAQLAHIYFGGDVAESLRLTDMIARHLFTMIDSEEIALKTLAFAVFTDYSSPGVFTTFNFQADLVGETLNRANAAARKLPEVDECFVELNISNCHGVFRQWCESTLKDWYKEFTQGAAKGHSIAETVAALQSMLILRETDPHVLTAKTVMEVFEPLYLDPIEFAKKAGCIHLTLGHNLDTSQWRIGQALYQLGVANAGNDQFVHAAFNQALAYSDPAATFSLRADATPQLLIVRGRVLAGQGELDAAVQTCEEAVTLANRMGIIFLEMRAPGMLNTARSMHPLSFCLYF